MRSFAPDSIVVREWLAQVAEASRTPGLAQHLVRRTGELFPRFASFYDKLRALPRRLRRVISRRRGLSLAAVAMLLALRGNELQAGTLVVDEICSLPNAIIAANTDVGTFGCPNGAGDDLILINTDVTLSGPLPAITNTLTIRAGSHSIVDGNGFSCFEVDSHQGAEIVLDGLTVRNCYAHYSGAAVHNHGKLTISGCTIMDNTAVNGGAIWSNWDLTIEDSVISGNVATESAGGVYLEGPASISRTVISGNRAEWDGGGILVRLHLIHPVEIVDCLVTGNAAGERGGGIAGETGWYGGGIVAVRGTTISGNTATVGGGLSSYAYGLNEVTVRNSTISGNTATTLGGGVYQSDFSCHLPNVATFEANTISNNTSGEEGGGLYLVCQNLSLSRSLVTGNAAPSGAEIVVVDSGRVREDAFNLIGYDGDARSIGFAPGPTDIVPAVGVQVGDILAPLSDNGGLTPTHTLVAGSPALDAIPSTDEGCAGMVDQRRYRRPVGTGCDIGSVETALSPQLGGSATGFVPSQAECANRATGQREGQRYPGTLWSCEGLGLAVNAGDRVETSATGIASSSAVGGSVTRMAPASVTCENVSTGQKVKSRTSATSWDCEVLGLVVTPGEAVTTGAVGTAD